MLSTIFLIKLIIFLVEQAISINILLNIGEQPLLILAMNIAPTKIGLNNELMNLNLN